MLKINVNLRSGVINIKLFKTKSKLIEHDALLIQA